MQYFVVLVNREIGDLQWQIRFSRTVVVETLHISAQFASLTVEITSFRARAASQAKLCGAWDGQHAANQSSVSGVPSNTTPYRHTAHSRQKPPFTFVSHLFKG